MVAWIVWDRLFKFLNRVCLLISPVSPSSLSRQISISKFCQTFRPYKVWSLNPSLSSTTLLLLTFHCTALHFILTHCCYAICKDFFIWKLFLLENFRRSVLRHLFNFDHFCLLLVPPKPQQPVNIMGYIRQRTYEITTANASVFLILDIYRLFQRCRVKWKSVKFVLME